ncbi:hypothetical protein [Halosimplex halophilum]|uniref:hypothetical protein n=1 Tax=Halosimplex halophilum TaxID=2559572 RepID=UPI00107F6B2D|nr:hypothetical protein [Halosimplex halophilum]
MSRSLDRIGVALVAGGLALYAAGPPGMVALGGVLLAVSLADGGAAGTGPDRVNCDECGAPNDPDDVRCQYCETALDRG